MQATGAIRLADQARYATGYWPLFLDRPYAPRDPLVAAYFTEFCKPSGCIAATAADMGRYLRYLIEAGSGKGAPLLSDPDAHLLTTPVADAPVYGPQAKYALGLGVVPIGGLACLHHTGGMTAFSSSIHVDPKTGVGAFVSTNAAVGEYRPRQVSYFACELLRSIREGTAMPLEPFIQRDDEIDQAPEYQGTYRSDAGELVTLRAAGQRLILTLDGIEVTMRKLDADAFLVRHPRFEHLPLTFERQQAAPMVAWWGETRFARAEAAAPPAASKRLAPLAGYYSSDDPWVRSAYVFVRGGQLWLDGTRPLVPESDGTFRVGPDTHGCERVSFDGFLDGAPQRMQFSGVDRDRDTAKVDGLFGRSP
jgi:D-alanyl-D-alanine carboxypeptidase